MNMDKNILPILMYHQIDHAPARNSPMRGMVVSPRTFAHHMQMLALLGWTGLAMPELMPYLAGEKIGKVFGITFDDGYTNNLEFAAPVLHTLGFGATCYVVSDLLGQHNAWDQGHGIAAKPLMTAGQLREWAELGLDIGSHTRTHCRLSTTSQIQAQAEIAGSKHHLEEILGHPVEHFCYPYGDYLPTHAELVALAGYKTATTVRRGRATAADSPYELPRVLMSRTTHALRLIQKLYTRYEDRRG
jgi:peptidoglycan/xylan/chitin deacetylase (PgdA/CDA1 family)